jgi:P27 family predicted phage terminase small subunit
MARPRKPTNIHELNGNPSKLRLADRKVTEPQPPKGKVAPPKWLSKEARKEWRRFVPILRSMKVLTVADTTALAIMCQHVADYVFYSAKIDELRNGEGEVAYTDKGYPVQNPYVNMATTASNMAKKYMSSFGLDPAARTKIEVDKGTEKPERVKPTARRGTAS